jgi:hypothetical protein
MLVDFRHEQDLASLLLGVLKRVGARNTLTFGMDNQGQRQSV